MEVLVHPNFDPAAITIFGRSIAWYGLMYLCGFAAAYLLGRYRAKRCPQWNPKEIEDMIFAGALAVIVGGRMGYMLFYDWPYYFEHEANDPWYEFIMIWDGGMSFHGGALAVVLAIAFVAWRTKKTEHPRSFLQVADFVVPLAPLGIFFGRMGNFINQELWGRVAGENAWFSMKFPKEALIEKAEYPMRAGQDVAEQLIGRCQTTGADVAEKFQDKCSEISANLVEALDVPARHPSQLYEAVLEGLVLFVILWVYSRKPRPVGSVAGLFLLGYGMFRGFVEFFRKPDEGIDFLLGTSWLTEGMLLSLPMILGGLLIIAISQKVGKVVETRYASVS